MKEVNKWGKKKAKPSLSTNCGDGCNEMQLLLNPLLTGMQSASHSPQSRTLQISPSQSGSPSSSGPLLPLVGHPSGVVKILAGAGVWNLIPLSLTIFLFCVDSLSSTNTSSLNFKSWQQVLGCGLSDGVGPSAQWQRCIPSSTLHGAWWNIWFRF